MVDGFVDGPAGVQSREFQVLVVSSVLNDDMVAPVAYPQFVALSNHLQGAVRPPPLEPVAELVEGRKEQTALADEREQLREVHVAPEHGVTVRNLDWPGSLTSKRWTPGVAASCIHLV